MQGPLGTKRALATLAVAAALLGAATTSGAQARSRATFAGGCFWCMEPPFDEIEGVEATVSGYAGGEIESPTYEQVASGKTKHAEVVQVVFDPAMVSYEELLRVFWRNVDPLDPGGQFCDRGSQYRSAILYVGEAQKRAALATRRAIEESGRFPWPIATEIVPLRAFYPAEDYHQDFYRREIRRYWSYRTSCGRDERLKQLWGEEPE
jgi:peptide-methionine (S)-S-oxide reductase